MFHIKSLVYWLILLCCMAYYIISKHQLVNKNFKYTTSAASEVFMVWGLVNDEDISKIGLPVNSYMKDGMVFTKMSPNRTSFYTSLTLPVNSNIYYWMVQRKDTAGNKIDIWDSGGRDKTSFNTTFNTHNFFKPGYFIFLAGLLPLVVFFFKQRNKSFKIVRVSTLSIKEYVPQLDSLRAIAVLLVIFHHWLPKENWINLLPNGALGVNTFFVLSGFLITSILLKSKDDVESKQISRTHVFKNFYIRRSLRIFPIYYLLLMLFWFLNDHEILNNGVYYFTYTSNFLFFNQQFFPARLAHLWSLAVEEQFYLIWPFLMIFVRKKWLPFVIGMFLTIGISTNYIITSKGWWVNIFTPACFDAFAVGAMLSFCSIYRHDIIKKLQRRYNWIFLFSFLLLLADIFNLVSLPSRTVHSLFAGNLVFYCLYQNKNRLANSILNNKWLQSMGKISYGIYLYHLFIPEIWGIVTKYAFEHHVDLLFNQSLPDNLKTTWLFIQHLIIVLLLSKLSWHLIEKPINLLKGRFASNAPRTLFTSVKTGNTLVERST